VLRHCPCALRPCAATPPACALPLVCLRVLRRRPRARCRSSVCVCCDAARVCAAARLSACVVAPPTSALPLVCLRVLWHRPRVCRTLFVLRCWEAACVHGAARLSACAAKLLTDAYPLNCLRVLRCCWHVRRPSSDCAYCHAAFDAVYGYTAPQQFAFKLAVVTLDVLSLSPWAGRQLVCERPRSACLRLTCRLGPTANGWHTPAALGQLTFKCANRKEKKTPSQSEIVHSENRFQPTGRQRQPSPAQTTLPPLLFTLMTSIAD
jgi:hypothetical protein